LRNYVAFYGAIPKSANLITRLFHIRKRESFLKPTLLTRVMRFLVRNGLGLARSKWVRVSSFEMGFMFHKNVMAFHSWCLESSWFVNKL